MRRSASDGPSSAPDPTRWRALAALTLPLVLVSLDTTALNVALATMQRSLGATTSDMAWVVDAYTLVFAALLVPMGLLADRWGRRRALLAGLVVLAAASGAASTATGVAALIVARAATGVGAALVLPATLAVIMTAFPAHERTRALGAWSASMGLGVALGPLVGGALLERWWWGSVLLVNVPVAALAVLWCALAVRESRDDAPRRQDPAGTALAALGVAAVVDAVLRAGEHAGVGHADVLVPAGVGVLALVGLALVERHVPEPVLDLGLLALRPVRAACGVLVLHFFTLLGLAFVLTYYLQAVRGEGPLAAGVALLPSAVGIALGSALAPLAVRRLGARRTVVAASALAATAVAATLAVGVASPAWTYEVPLLAVGLGVGAGIVPATDTIMAAGDPVRSGPLAAFATTMRLVGTALGVAALGSLLTAGYRSHAVRAIGALPAAARDDAQGSIAGTLEAVAAAVRGGALDPAAARGVTAAARSAFVAAQHTAVAWGAAALGLAVLVAWLGLPGRVAHPRRAHGTTLVCRSGGPMPQTVPSEPRRPGRPRSAAADEAILRAALDELAGSGTPHVTIEGVAARAGVARSTVYRRWANAYELATDALALVAIPVLKPSGTSVRGDLLDLLRNLRAALTGSRLAELLPALAAQAREQPDASRRYWVEQLDRGAGPFGDVLRRGVAEGIVRADLDVELAIDLLTGPLWKRTLWQLETSDADLESTVDTVLAGLRPAYG